MSVTTFAPGGVPIGYLNGAPVTASLELANALNTVTDRTGGVLGPFNISASQVTSGEFEDARISQSSVTQHFGSIEITASQVTSGAFQDARISQSSVTQHQSALDFQASQITAGEIADARISRSSVQQHLAPVIRAVSSDYTITATDQHDVIAVDAAATLTIPTGLSGPVEVYRTGASDVTITGASGVTINGTDAGTDVISTQWDGRRAQDVDTDVWVLR